MAALGTLADKSPIQTNTNVTRGLAGANTLGLRQTENAARLAQRGSGTLQERVARLNEGFSQCLDGDKVSEEGKSLLEDGLFHDIDDTWEDETGRVRSTMLRNVKDRAARHELDPHKKKKKKNPLIPQLPLVYTDMGQPAPPYRIMDEAQFHKWFTKEFAPARHREGDGSYVLKFSDTVNLKAVKQIEKAAEWPPMTKRIVSNVNSDRSSRDMEPAPGELQNRLRGMKVIEEVDRGAYRIHRVTNAGDFTPQLVTSSHISWPQYLGQHISTIWEYIPPEVLEVIAKEKGVGVPPPAAAADTGALPPPAPTSEPVDGGAAGGGTDAPLAMPPPPPSFESELMATLLAAESLEEDTDYRCELIRRRFEQFYEYLERPAEGRECVQCHQPGADCCLLPCGDYHTNGLEWDDPVCFCMTCRTCATSRMADSDLHGDMTMQRCVGCWQPYGGFQVHNNATKKLMLMQAATQLMLFCGPRRDGEPEETFEQQVARRSCLKAIMECGLMRALSIPVGTNNSTEFQMLDYDNLTSHGWSMWLSPKREQSPGTTGYVAASIDGRILLRLAEAEAQLDNLANALTAARRGAELLMTLDKGQGLPATDKDGATVHRTLREIGHPARALLEPAHELIQKLAASQKEMVLEDKRAKGAREGSGGDRAGERKEGDGSSGPRDGGESERPRAAGGSGGKSHGKKKGGKKK